MLRWFIKVLNLKTLKSGNSGFVIFISLKIILKYIHSITHRYIRYIIYINKKVNKFSLKKYLKDIYIVVNRIHVKKCISTRRGIIEDFRLLRRRVNVESGGAHRRALHPRQTDGRGLDRSRALAPRSPARLARSNDPHPVQCNGIGERHLSWEVAREGGCRVERCLIDAMRSRRCLECGDAATRKG